MSITAIVLYGRHVTREQRRTRVIHKIQVQTVCLLCEVHACMIFYKELTNLKYKHGKCFTHCIVGTSVYVLKLFLGKCKRNLNPVDKLGQQCFV